MVVARLNAKSHGSIGKTNAIPPRIADASAAKGLPARARERRIRGLGGSCPACRGGQSCPRAFDVILNASGALPYAKAKRLPKLSGMLIERSQIIPLFIGSKLATPVRTRQHLALAVAPKRDDLETIASLAVQGRVAATSARRFAFSEAKAALIGAAPWASWSSASPDGESERERALVWISRLGHQRRTRGPSAAPRAPVSAIPAVYQAATKAIAASGQCSA